jgi:5-(carboxyamino)imidazole ribonucleotide mutase
LVPVRLLKLAPINVLVPIVQMPGGVPVGTLAIGEAGAKNAALLAIRMLARSDTALRERLRDFQVRQAEAVRQDSRL